MRKQNNTQTADNARDEIEATDAVEQEQQESGAEEQDSGPTAAPNGGQIVTRSWTMQGTGNEIPVRYDKAVVRFRRAAPSTDATQAMLNMLALTGGDAQAVLDMFNGSAALAVQKAIKTRIKADAAQDPAVQTTLEDLQSLADTYVIQASRRGGGSAGGKRAAQAAKAARLDAVQDAAAQANAELAGMWESDTHAAQIQTALMVRLGLLTAEQAAEISGGRFAAA
jgi:hypothetical protein